MIMMHAKSEEVGHKVPVMFAVGTFLHSIKNDKIAISIFIQPQNSSLISHPVAVVRRRP